MTGWPTSDVIDAEQLEPGRVGVDDDAFLDLHDRIVRALQHGFELAAGVVRGFEGGVQRALEAERAQLAQHHRLQARGVANDTTSRAPSCMASAMRASSTVIRQCR